MCFINLLQQINVAYGNTTVWSGDRSTWKHVTDSYRSAFLNPSGAFLSLSLLFLAKWPPDPLLFKNEAMTDPLFLKGHIPTLSPFSWSPFSPWPVDCGIGEVRDIPTLSFPQSLARLMKCLSANMLHLTGMCTLHSAHSFYSPVLGSFILLFSLGRADIPQEQKGEESAVERSETWPLRYQEFNRS